MSFAGLGGALAALVFVQAFTAAHSAETSSDQIAAGQSVFKKIWGPSDGLGPHFNTRSCQSCHLNGGRGAAPTRSNRHSDSMTLKLGMLPASEVEASKLLTRIISSFPEPTYGHQLQTRSLGDNTEGTFSVTYQDVEVRLSDDTVTLKQPILTVNAPGHAQGMLTSPRIANSLLGLGLLEAIPEQSILAKADIQDLDKDGISGKPNMIRDVASSKVRLGRFGWKAGQPSIRQQNAAAFALDIGLSTSLFPKNGGDCTPIQPGCTGPETPQTPEVSDQLLDALTAYISTLGVTEPKKSRRPEVVDGERLFRKAGCDACHTPKFTTSSDPNLPEHLRNKQIAPYSDLLLHDMGDGLADNFLEGDADYWEWRTPPLWGISKNADINGNNFYLHDGRARTLLEAILWHGGEAQAARDAVAKMTRQQRERLIAFLRSI